MEYGLLTEAGERDNLSGKPRNSDIEGRAGVQKESEGTFAFLVGSSAGASKRNLAISLRSLWKLALRYIHG